MMTIFLKLENGMRGSVAFLLLLFVRFKIMILVCLSFCCADVFGQKQKIWLDADTGNETDDVYAIVRLLNHPSVELVGLSSAHFNNVDLVAFDRWNQYDTKNINTVKISQQLNEEILQLSGKLNISHPMGADRQMGRAWGGSQPRNSKAAQQIISTVKLLKDNELLDIICLGALTNIASAIALDTSIAKHIKCYILGTKYISEMYWDKNEFNIRNDLNAFDYLLDNPSVNLVIMPITTAFPFRFIRDSLYKALGNSQPVLKYLKQRWVDTNPNDTVRTLWDVALVEAYLNPSFCSIKTVLTPFENFQRNILVYTKIDTPNMEKDYWTSIEKIKKN